MYTIRNTLNFPDYLKHFFQVLGVPFKFQDRIHVKQVIIPYQKCRLQLLKKSFVPDVINQWNWLQIEAVDTTSFNI